MKKLTVLWMQFLIFSTIFAQVTPENMLENALSAVVSVGVYKADATNQVMGFRGPSDVAYQKQLDLSDAYSRGSGFVVEMNGKKYIATNAHVVQMATNENGAIYVFTINRNKYEVKIKGGDSFYDFALLEFVTAPGPEITAMKFMQEEPRIGQKVYAIGNPLAEYPYTVSDGIVSAKNRVRDGVVGKYGFIQSTATIIWGNSGGPLVNEKGDVVGMNSQIAFAPESHGGIWQPQINFALESKVCQRLVNDILTNNGRIRRAFLGIELSQNYQAETDAYTQKSTLKKTDDVPVISNVFYNSPANDVLSAKTGYSLIKINDSEVRNMEEALGEFEKVRPGDKVTLTIVKNGMIEKVSIATQELEPSRMAGLAKSMIEKDPSYKLTSNDGDVYISFTKAYAPDYERRYNNRWQQTNEYKVVGIGEVSDNESSVYRVGSVSDLGTALRFYGLAGFYDLVTLDKNDPSAKPQTTRVYLSGDQNVLKRTLWY